MRISSRGILNSIKNNYHKIIPFTTDKTPTKNALIIILFWGIIGFGYGSFLARNNYMKSNYIAALAGPFVAAFCFKCYVGIPVALFSLGGCALFGNESGMPIFLGSSIAMIVGIYKVFSKK